MIAPTCSTTTAYLGGQSFRRGGRAERLPAGPDKVIARRAAAEVRPGVVTIFGFGASSDIPAVDGWRTAPSTTTRSCDYRFTTEHGPFGGLVMSGWQFSANSLSGGAAGRPVPVRLHRRRRLRVRGARLRPVRREGNVNVSRFGAANPGPGGFIDIAYNAEGAGVHRHLHHGRPEGRDRRGCAGDRARGQASRSSSGRPTKSPIRCCATSASAGRSPGSSPKEPCSRSRRKGSSSARWRRASTCASRSSTSWNSRRRASSIRCPGCPPRLFRP